MKFANFKQIFTAVLILLVLITICVSSEFERRKKSTSKDLLARVGRIMKIVFERYARYDGIITSDKKVEPSLWVFGYFSRFIYGDNEAEKIQTYKLQAEPKLLEEFTNKKQFLKDVIARNPKLNDYQKIGISYYIGKQLPIYLKSNKDKVNLSIQKFIELSRINGSNTNYFNFLKQMIKLNEGDNQRVLQELDKLKVAVYTDLLKDFDDHFESKDSKLFETSKSAASQARFLQKKRSGRGKLRYRSMPKLETAEAIGVLSKIIDRISNIATNSLGLVTSYQNCFATSPVVKTLNSALGDLDMPYYKNKVGNSVLLLEIGNTFGKLYQGTAPLDEILKCLSNVAVALTGFRYKWLSDLNDVEKKSIDLLSNLYKLRNSSEPAEQLSELLIVAGITMTFLPSFTHVFAGNLLQFTGRQVIARESIRNLVNEKIPLSAKDAFKSHEQGSYLASAYLHSDFASDDASRTPTIQEMKQEIEDYIKKFDDRKAKYELANLTPPAALASDFMVVDGKTPTYDELKTEITGYYNKLVKLAGVINDKVEKRYDQGNFTPSAAMASDFMTVDADVPEFKEIKKELKGYYDKLNTILTSTGKETFKKIQTESYKVTSFIYDTSFINGAIDVTNVLIKVGDQDSLPDDLNPIKVEQKKKMKQEEAERQREEEYINNEDKRAQLYPNAIRNPANLIVEGSKNGPFNDYSMKKPYESQFGQSVSKPLQYLYMKPIISNESISNNSQNFNHASSLLQMGRKIHL